MKTIWNYNENINISKSKNLGNTYTHPYISENIILKLIDNNKNYNKILEPCVGVGSFYNSIKQYLKVNEIDCFDIDKNSISLIEKRKQDNFFIEDFLLYNKNEKYDLIITNPPYVSYNNISSNIYKNKIDYLNEIKNKLNYEILGINKEDIDLKSDLFIYFFLKSLTLLKDDGKLLFLCSDKWLDANYGKVLKKVLLNNFKLETIVTSNYYPFFKDDTNAIITIISKRKKNERNKLNVYSIIEPKFELNNKFEFSFEEVFEIFNNKNLNLNNKNKLLFYQEEYNFTVQTINNNKSKFIELGQLIEIIPSNITFNTLLKNNKVFSKDELNNKLAKENILKLEEKNIFLSLFYQDQARPNKPIHYKQIINKDELKYYINKKDIDNKYIYLKGIYMSSMIDRLPLFYYVDFETIGVSKYYFIKPKIKIKDDKVFLFLLNNILTIQSLETFIKDGTKKTHRKNENGYAKEVTKNALEKILVPNIFLLKDKELKELLNIQKKYNSLELNSIENILNNKDYIELQKKLLFFLNINVDFDKLINNVKQIYFKRMRNLKMLKMKLNK